MRLAIVGPVPPFRSGVAEHTYMLARALEPCCQLLVVSFARQYPRWLFPGESDRGAGQANFSDTRCEFLLDPLAPATWGRTVELLVAHRPDAVIIPWWTIYWAPCITSIANRLWRHGIRVVFFCHNVLDHEAAWWKKVLTGAVLRRGDGYFVQSSAERERLLSLGAQGPITVHPHPVFTQFPAPTSALPRRASLELLFFGLVRPYKGLDVLLRALARLCEADVMLTVAGEFWGGLDATRRLIGDLGIGDRVELVPRYVSGAEAADYFARADVIVLPYLKATGSGVLGLAYHYGKPVVASRIPGIAELVQEGKTGILSEPGSVDRLADALRSMSAERASAMLPEIAAQAARLTWDSLATAVVEHIQGRVR